MRYLAATLITLLLPSPVTAQKAEPWPARVVVGMNVPFQPIDDDFSESLSFADPGRPSENVTFVASYESARGALLDAGVGVRLLNDVGAGVAISWLERTRSGSFDLSVPSPIVANRPLGLSGSVAGLGHRELGFHISVLYALALGAETRVMLSAGPSIFDVRHDLVRSIEFDKLPGFAGLAFHDAVIVGLAEVAVGFNASADVLWPFGSHFGLAAVARYTRATATMDPGAESGVGRAIEVRAGGLQLGGGVRLLF